MIVLSWRDENIEFFMIFLKGIPKKKFPLLLRFLSKKKIPGNFHGESFSTVCVANH